MPTASDCRLFTCIMQVDQRVACCLAVLHLLRLQARCRSESLLGVNEVVKVPFELIAG